jgi:hypothetical protein
MRLTHVNPDASMKRSISEGMLQLPADNALQIVRLAGALAV